MPKITLDLYYVLVMSDGLGNTTFSDDLLYHLKEIKKLLIEKYGDSDYRVKFLTFCIIKEETGEYDVQDQEWIRYILHQESEPNEQHERLLNELKERMEHAES